jgi:hypothetical protein
VKRVYASASLWQAREILALLEQQRLPVTLLNEYAAGTPGILPFNRNMAVDAEIWVLDDELAERCRRLINEFHAAQAAPGTSGEPAWSCTGCGEENPASFDLCWACGQAR